jgi:hypothetical protein
MLLQREQESQAMKKFIRTLKTLGERAAQFQETLQLVPPRVAEVRQAVSLTSAQLRQLQADVQLNVASLKAENPDRLVDALQEINGSLEVFQEAGYELGHVEMELSPVPRLIVHLDRVRDVRGSILQALSNANRERRTTHALLNAIIQAEAVADRVDIQGQVYYRLVVHVGPVPSVRLGWMPAPEPASAAAPAVAPTPAKEAAAASHFSPYGQGSFFATQSGPAGSPDSGQAAVTSPSPPASVSDAAAHVPPQTEASSRARHEAEITAQRPAGMGWGASALERFKHMPGASKYSRRNL